MTTPRISQTTPHFPMPRLSPPHIISRAWWEALSFSYGASPPHRHDQSLSPAAGPGGERDGATSHAGWNRPLQVSVPRSTAAA